MKSLKVAHLAGVKVAANIKHFVFYNIDASDILDYQRSHLRQCFVKIQFGNQSTTLNVIYRNVCHTTEGYESAKIQGQLSVWAEKSMIVSNMVARNKCKWVWYPGIWCVVLI